MRKLLLLFIFALGTFIGTFAQSSWTLSSWDPTVYIRFTSTNGAELPIKVFIPNGTGFTIPGTVGSPSITIEVTYRDMNGNIVTVASFTQLLSANNPPPNSATNSYNISSNPGAFAPSNGFYWDGSGQITAFALSFNYTGEFVNNADIQIDSDTSPLHTTPNYYKASGLAGVSLSQSNGSAYLTGPFGVCATVYNVIGGGVICTNQTATISSSGSQNKYLFNGTWITKSYQLLKTYQGVTTAIGAPVVGNGGRLDWTGITDAGSYTIQVTGIHGCTTMMNGSQTVSIVNGNPPNVSVNPSSPTTCKNVPITLTASGADSYSWGPSNLLLSPSPPNTAAVIATLYSTTSLTVTGTNSNGCSNSKTVTVLVNELPVQYTLNASNGGLICGPSGVTIGLSNSQSTVNYQLKNLTNGSNYGSAIAGTSGTALSWPNVTVAGTYSVLATSTATGCTQTMLANQVVTLGTLQSLSLSPPSPATICSGSSLSLSASGATSYSWTPITGLSPVANGTVTSATVTATPSATTTYTVTGTTNGCVFSKSITINVNTRPNFTQPITVDGNPISNPDCSVSIPFGADSNHQIVAIGSSGATTFTLTPSNLFTSAITSTTYSWFIKNTSLSYSINVTIGSGGCVNTACLYFSNTPGGNGSRRATHETADNLDMPDVDKFSVYPNPANQELTVALPYKVKTQTPVIIYNVLGRIEAAGMLQEGEWKIKFNTGGMAGGLYIVKTGSGDFSQSVKAMVQR